ncbi:MAG: hypothetical protein IK085_06540 [Clostridia bacterium]|nr:hypothetical protein [Clostridia bacterium]
MKKTIAFLMATIMMMSAFSSYACIAVSAVSTDEVVCVSDVLTSGKEKQSAQKISQPDKEEEEEPLEETSDINFRKDIKKFFRKIIEIIKAFFAFFRHTETPEPEAY